MADSNFGELLDTTVRVVTWNLWWRYGPWEQRLPRICETLRRVEPDVVALQEVWIDERAGTSSAHVVAGALGFDHVVTSCRIELEDGIGFGNAVISRWPIPTHEWRPLPSPAELDEFRTVLRADVAGPRGPFQVFSTHLHWRLDHSHIRQDQVRAICEFVADSPDRSYPAILCGDLNADPMCDEIRMLTGRTSVPVPPIVFFDAWEIAGDGPGLTWSNDNPYAVRDLEFSRRLDYVLVGFPKAHGAGNPVRAVLVGVDEIDGLVPSDHYGVVTDLRY